MLTTDLLVFPNNIVNEIAIASERLDPTPPDQPRIHVYKRPLRETDAHQSIGVFASQWNPTQDSYEMRGSLLGSNPASGRHEPSLAKYLVAVQGFVRDPEEERGLAIHAVLSKLLRNMLYRDPRLTLALSQLSVTIGTTTERAKRWEITTQKFISNELQSNWLYLSTLELTFEVETT